MDKATNGKSMRKTEFLLIVAHNNGIKTNYIKANTFNMLTKVDMPLNKQTKPKLICHWKEIVVHSEEEFKPFPLFSVCIK